MPTFARVAHAATLFEARAAFLKDAPVHRHLAFEFDAPSIEDAGRRIRELATAAEAVDFELEGVGKVEEAP